MTQEQFDTAMTAALEDFRANGISHAKDGLDKVVRFQDLIGHATMIMVKEYEASLDYRMKDIFIWALASCSGPDLFGDIIRNTLVERQARESIIEAHRKVEGRDRTIEILRGQIEGMRDRQQRAIATMRDIFDPEALA